MSAVQLGPMLRRLARNRTAALSLAVEIAFGLTVAVHSVAIPLDLLERARPEPGLAPESLWAVTAWGAQGQALAALPGVRAVSRVERPLQEPGQLPRPVRAADEGAGPIAWTMGADAGLLEVLGQPLRAGRWPAAPGEVAVSESLARALFGGGPAAGQLLFGPEPLRITGVVPDLVLANNWVPSPRHALLHPLAASGRRAVFMVRSEAADFPQRARAALAAAGPVKVERMTERLAFNNANATGTLYVIALMVALLLVVTALGAAAMVAHLVAARTREIGLRRALGAEQGAVVRHFVVETGLVVAAGLALGLVATALVATVASAPGPWLVASAAAVFAAVALFAAWLPARRAAAVAPSVAGRSV